MLGQLLALPPAAAAPGPALLLLLLLRLPARCAAPAPALLLGGVLRLAFGALALPLLLADTVRELLLEAEAQALSVCC